MTDFLQLKYLRATAVNEAPEGYLVEATGAAAPRPCVNCSSVLLYRHGSVEQDYRDTPSHGRAVTIRVTRQRFRCQQCTRTQSEEIPDLDDRRLATRRLLEYVQRESFRRPFLPIAKDIGLDEKTVRNIFEDHIADLRSSIRFQTPTYLGIDELKVIGDYRCMITNIEKRCIFDLLPTRRQQDLMGYFQALPDKGKIEWVAMDMWGVYRAVVKKQLPDARIVVDRFHIQRMANNSMEAIRKEVRRSLSARQRLKLKNDRFVLLKRLHNLNPVEIQVFGQWSQEFPQLAEAHALKEGFLSIWDSSSRAGAEQAFTRWAAAIPEPLQKTFGAIANTVDAWSEQIFNYWDKPITNAYTEAVNGVAKGMNRMGRGYSFEVLRARLLYNPKARAATAEKIRTPVDDAPPFLIEKFSMGRVTNSTRQRMRYAERVIEYGPSLEVIAQLLADGAFDDY